MCVLGCECPVCKFRKVHGVTLCPVAPVKGAESVTARPIGHHMVSGFGPGMPPGVFSYGGRVTNMVTGHE